MTLMALSTSGVPGALQTGAVHWGMTSTTSDELRIVFMGTPAFAVPSLRALLDLETVAGRPSRVVAVVTQPDRPAGRGGRVQASPVKLLAQEARVPVLQPERLRRPENVAALGEARPDLVVVAAFAQILSRAVLDTPTHGCLNVHASLLPRWRGASPINAAILAGDAETGVTIMRMAPGLDTGPILTQCAEPIRPDDTTATLTERLSHVGADLLARTVGPWIAGELVPQEQDESQATPTRLLTRDDGRIDWTSTPAAVVERMARAYDPWPGASTAHAGRTLKLWSATVLADTTTSEGEGATPGQVLAREQALSVLQRLDLPWPQLIVATVDGLLVVRRIQPEGKRIMGGDDYMRGQPDIAGAQLGE